MTRFSDAAWQRTARLRQAIHDLPFNTELADGSLGRARFQGYVIQDALYLGQYSRVPGNGRGEGARTAKRYARSRNWHWKRWLSSRRFTHAICASSASIRRGWRRPSRHPIASATPVFCWPPPITSRGRYWSPRCFPASGSTGMWAAPFPSARRQPIRIGRGSTPTPMRASVPRCARSSASPTGLLRRDTRRGEAHDGGVYPLDAVRVAVLGLGVPAAWLADRRLMERRAVRADHPSARGNQGMRLISTPSSARLSACSGVASP